MPCPWTNYVRLFALVAFTFFLPSQSAHSAEKHPRAVLIIDGSGSMWGRIDKREKIVIVREQLADKVASLKDKVELGVMSYGHRRRRDCRDIEMIVPIGPVKPKPYGETIKRLLPRGKTPVASALQMAADALALPEGQKNTSEKAHIILVADGNENCRLDPCKTARDLASKNPGLTIDVIGFGINEADVEQLQCIASATKGRFHKADDSTQLERAIVQIFARLGTRTAPPVAAKPQKKKIPAGLYLAVGLARQGAPLEKDVNWRIYRAGESSKTGATPLHRDNSATPFFKLPKGKYHVESRHKDLITEQDVELKGGTALKLRLGFNVGIVTTNARLGKTAPLLGNIIFSLYDASSGPTGPGNIIAHKQEENAVFYLPPGKYRLKARAGETQAHHDFTLKAGERKNHTLLLNAGQVSLKALLAVKTTPLVDVQYTIFQHFEKKQLEFIRTLDPSPDLILPAGDYFVLARQGSASNYTKLSVSAGETKTVSLVLNAGILKLSSDLQGGGNDQQVQIAYTIEPEKPASPRTIKLSPNNSLVEVAQSLPTRSFRNTFVLPAGRYLVHALYGNSNAEAVTQVEVKAGQKIAHTISMSAGRVKLSLALEKGNPPLPGVFWSIIDRTGKQIASASAMTPNLTLSSGSYQVVADYLGQSYKRDIVVKNGENRKIQLHLQ